jgi:hypothetical protein
MERCFICRCLIAESRVCRRVMPVASHRGVTTSVHPALFAATSYAPVTLCPECDALETQRVHERLQLGWFAKFMLSLISLSFIFWFIEIDIRLFKNGYWLVGSVLSGTTLWLAYRQWRCWQFRRSHILIERGEPDEKDVQTS